MRAIEGTRWFRDRVAAPINTSVIHRESHEVETNG
jgi:hypothetical protein